MRVPDEKTRRQRKILDLVERHDVGSQDELGQALVEEGFEVAQSTLSRDLRDLGMVRTRTADGYRYVPAERLSTAGRPRDLGEAGRVVRSVTCSESTIVIRTRVGRAQGVAVDVDRMKLENVLGTVAGNDTILVVPSAHRHTKSLRKKLAAMLGTD